MNTFNLNSAEEAAQNIVAALSSMPNADYLLLLSGNESLLSYYKTLATTFSYPFPKHVGVLDDVWTEDLNDKSSTVELLKRSGLMGRIIWEKSEFHPIFSENASNPKVEVGGYNSEMLELMQIYKDRVMSVSSMDSRGGFSGIAPFSEAVQSDDVFVTYEDAVSKAIIASTTVQCMMVNVSKSVLIVGSDEKWGLFTRVIEQNESLEEFPVVALKNIANSEAYCFSS